MAKEPKKPTEKKDKKGKKGEAASASPNAMSVAAHPRASYAVARAKGLGGLIGLLLVGFLSYRAGAPMFDVALRALVGGVAGYLAFWALALQAWRHLVVAEARATARRLEERAAAQSEGA
jgi:hypothetical protein